jgi:hypothetical protein
MASDGRPHVEEPKGRSYPAEHRRGIASLDDQAGPRKKPAAAGADAGGKPQAARSQVALSGEALESRVCSDAGISRSCQRALTSPALQPPMFWAQLDQRERACSRADVCSR